MLDVEEEESLPLPVGAGAMAFALDILDGEGGLLEIVANTGNDQLGGCQMLKVVGKVGLLTKERL